MPLKTTASSPSLNDLPEGEKPSASYAPPRLVVLEMPATEQNAGVGVDGGVYPGSTQS